MYSESFKKISQKTFWNQLHDTRKSLTNWIDAIQIKTRKKNNSNLTDACDSLLKRYEIDTAAEKDYDPIAVNWLKWSPSSN